MELDDPEVVWMKRNIIEWFYRDTSRSEENREKGWENRKTAQCSDDPKKGDKGRHSKPQLVRPFPFASL